MIHYLNSIDDSRLAPFRDLDRTNRTRNDDWFIGEGRLVVQRMLDSDYAIQSVVVGDHVDDDFRAQVPAAADLFVLPRESVSALVGFDFHSGILGCAKRRRMKRLEEIQSPLAAERSTVVICPFTVLPDNLGSIARLCAGFGVDALIVGKDSADPFSRRALRVSMANVLQVPVLEPEDLLACLQSLQQSFDFSLVAATGHAHDSLLPLERPAPRMGLVVGNEADGIPESILSRCDARVSIPMSGSTDSLNVANATAILLYQFLRVDG